MAENKIVSSDEVEANLTTILEYLIQVWGVSTAEHFFNIYLSKIDLLRQNPKLGRVSPKSSQVRSINITKHNRLFYG